MKDKLYDMKIWYGVRKMKVTSIRLETVKSRLFGESQKLVISLEDNHGISFEVSDIWTEDRAGGISAHGLWYSPENYNGNTFFLPSSAIAKLMKYYECKCLGEMIGLAVELYPDDNNYLVLASCKMNKSQD